MSYLDHIHACNRWEPGDFLPFVVGGERLGTVRRGFAAALAAVDRASAGTSSAAFVIRDDALHWVSAPDAFEARSSAMQALCADLEQRGLVSHLHGERYPATPGRREDARFLVDRACAPYFGLRAFGQHLNGYVRRADGLYLWVARRSASRRVYPSHLDNMVAGGLPWGIDLAENLRKECFEEASMPAEIADRALPVGAVTYCRDSDRGLKPDVIYCYDLQLPEDFEPRCNDDEVAGFELWPVQQVMSVVSETDAFKLNCNLVIIDFLVRHGLIGPEHEDYLAIVQGLRAPLF
jgi:isopentenyldiphosphate isomerase